MSERLTAVGDIHGCLFELRWLVDCLQLQKDELLVFLGDYIDRGLYSSAVIDYLVKLENQHPCIFLRGNHEAMMLASCNEPESEITPIWMENGGFMTLKSYGKNKPSWSGIPEPHRRFIERTLPFFITERYFFAHAGADPALSIQKNLELSSDDVFYWTRDHLRRDRGDLAWEKTLICGHTIFSVPLHKEKVICIDTGAYRSYWPGGQGRLTAIRLPSFLFQSVSFLEATSILESRPPKVPTGYSSSREGHFQSKTEYRAEAIV